MFKNKRFLKIICLVSAVLLLGGFGGIFLTESRADDGLSYTGSGAKDPWSYVSVYNPATGYIPAFCIALDISGLGNSYSRDINNSQSGTGAVAAAIEIPASALEELRYSIAITRCLYNSKGEILPALASARLPQDTFNRNRRIGSDLTQDLIWYREHIADPSNFPNISSPAFTSREIDYYYNSDNPLDSRGLRLTDTASVEVIKPSSLTKDANGFIGPYTIRWTASSSEVLKQLNREGEYKNLEPYMEFNTGSFTAYASNNPSASPIAGVRIGSTFYLKPIGDTAKVTLSPRGTLIYGIRSESVFKDGHNQPLYALDLIVRNTPFDIMDGGSKVDKSVTEYNGVDVRGDYADRITIDDGSSGLFKINLFSEHNDGTMFVFGHSSRPTNPIEIYTATQLASIGRTPRYPMNGNYKLMNDIDMSAFNAKYGAWTPIGGVILGERQVFTGTLDGQGYTIKNIRSTGSEFAGLFRELRGATVRNLVIDSGLFTCSDDYESMAGAVAACIDITAASTIQNVVVSNSTVNAYYVRDDFGGFYGRTYNSPYVTYPSQSSSRNVAITKNGVASTSNLNMSGGSSLWANTSRTWYSLGEVVYVWDVFNGRTLTTADLLDSSLRPLSASGGVTSRYTTDVLTIYFKTAALTNGTYTNRIYLDTGDQDVAIVDVEDVVTNFTIQIDKFVGGLSVDYPLDGAEFQVIKYQNGNFTGTETVVSTIRPTYQNPTVIGPLNKGAYRLVETVTPAGYTKEAGDIYFYVDSTGVRFFRGAPYQNEFTTNILNQKYFLKVYNTPTTPQCYPFTVRKFCQGDNINTAKQLLGSQFAIFRHSGTDFTEATRRYFGVLKPGTSEDNIMLPYGYYTVFETVAPQDYELDSTEYHLIVTSAGIQVIDTHGAGSPLAAVVLPASATDSKGKILNAFDKPKVGRVIIDKKVVDKDGNPADANDYAEAGLPDQDYTFGIVIRNVDNGKVYNGILHKNSTLYFENLPLGKYEIVEVTREPFEFVKIEMVSVSNSGSNTFDGNKTFELKYLANGTGDGISQIRFAVTNKLKPFGFSDQDVKDNLFKVNDSNNGIIVDPYSSMTINVLQSPSGIYTGTVNFTLKDPSGNVVKMRLDSSTGTYIVDPSGTVTVIQAKNGIAVVRGIYTAGAYQLHMDLPANTLGIMDQTVNIKLGTQVNVYNMLKRV